MAIENIDQYEKSGRPEGAVWEHFIKGRQTKAKSRQYPATCHYCGWHIKRQNINAMQSHLANNCHKIGCNVKEEYRHIFESEIDEMTSQPTRSTSTSKKRKLQTSITDHYDHNTITIEQKRAADKSLIRFFIASGIPFNVVKNPFFIDFCHVLKPGYNPPNR